jgi:hypothetical protein
MNTCVLAEKGSLLLFESNWSLESLHTISYSHNCSKDNFKIKIQRPLRRIILSKSVVGTSWNSFMILQEGSQMLLKLSIFYFWWLWKQGFLRFILRKLNIRGERFIVLGSSYFACSHLITSQWRKWRKLYARITFSQETCNHLCVLF